MPRLFCSLILLTCLFDAVYACETPKRVITAYLKYDFEGERLGGGDGVSVNIDKLTANPYEPAWDVMTLTTRYEIQSIKQGEKSAVITVEFKNSWETTRKFHPTSVKNEIIEIHVEKTKGCWKVAPPFYQPHVSPTTGMRHLEKLIEDGKKDKMDKEYMDYTQSVLDSTHQYMSAIGIQ